MNGKRRNAAILLLALLPSGCVTSTQATRLQKDLDDVKRQVFQVQQDTSGSRAQIEELSRTLAGGAAPAGQADLQASLRGLIDQVQSISERMDDLKSRLAALSQEIQSLRAAGAPGAPARGMSPSGPAPESSGGGDGRADQAFKTAYADYSKGNYELAVMGFGDFLKSHPGHPLAADAQYWIGECLYSAGKYDQAAEAMQRALEKYPAGERTPATLLKKGYAQIESGKTPMAVATLQKLIEEYPQSDEARLAAERLRQLGLRAN